MKKFLTFTLAIAMILTMGSIPAFAATIETKPGTDDHDVYGTYVAGSSGGNIYSVNVSWQALEFTYTGETVAGWNPGTHQYDSTTPAAWTSTTNNITVTNHSNVYVIVTFGYASIGAFDGVITGSFSGPRIISNAVTLQSADGLATDDAKLSATATLTLDGDLDSGTTPSTKIGTVTVTIN